MPTSREQELEDNLSGIFSNYCGYGGSGTITGDTDQGCYEHDADFGQILKDNPGIVGYIRAYAMDNYGNDNLRTYLKNLKTPRTTNEKFIRWAVQTYATATSYLPRYNKGKTQL